MCIYIDDNLGLYTGERLRAALDELPSWRLGQALRYRHETGQAQSAVSYLLLCRALREEFGVREKPAFRYDVHGKPYLALSAWDDSPVPQFSLSHCRDAVAAVVGRCPVGVDVECRGRYRESLASYVLSEAELASLPADAEQRDLQFTRLWTRKEAVAKLLGTGLCSSETIKRLLDEPGFHFEEIVTPCYVCTAVIKTKQDGLH